MIRAFAFFAFAAAMGASSAAWACSEPGVMNLEVSKQLQESCAKAAGGYAQALAQAMARIEAGKGDVPRAPFKQESATKYLAEKGAPGASDRLGFNVGLKSRNGWACDFCVDFAVTDATHCHISQVTKHMCAK
jgi:hypothetical protein